MTETNTIISNIDNPHSVEFTINAKGLWAGKIKVYSTNPEEAYNKAIELAEKLEKQIKTKNNL